MVRVGGWGWLWGLRLARVMGLVLAKEQPMV